MADTDGALQWERFMPSSSASGAIHLHTADNVAVTTVSHELGTIVHLSGRAIQLAEPIAMGHKVAVEPIGVDQPVRKYGQVIGHTTQPVAPGQWVHSPQSGATRVSARLCQRRAHSARPAGDHRSHFSRVPTQQWQGGNTQLHCGDLDGQLFRFGQQVHCAPVWRVRAAGLS